MNDQPPKPRTALVIGSGGLKCAAALGVWQVLREAGIEIDMTVGCSGGSLYATAIALGYSQEEAAALTQNLWTAELAQQRHKPSIRQAILPRLFGFRAGNFGLIDDRLIMAQLDDVLGDTTFTEHKAAPVSGSDRFGHGRPNHHLQRTAGGWDSRQHRYSDCVCAMGGERPYPDRRRRNQSHAGRRSRARRG